MKGKAIGFSFLWTAVLFGFYGIYRAIPYTGEFHFLIRVLFYALAAFAMLIYARFERITLKDFGYLLPEKTTCKTCFYFIPLLAAILAKIIFIAILSHGGQIRFLPILEYMVSGVVIVAVEELYFRGYILKKTGKAFSRVKGIFISAAMFTLYKALFYSFMRFDDPLQSFYYIMYGLVDTFVIGVTAAAIFSECKSVLPIIAWRLVLYVIESEVWNAFDYISTYVLAFYAGYLIYRIYRSDKVAKELENTEVEFNDTFVDDESGANNADKDDNEPKFEA